MTTLAVTNFYHSFSRKRIKIKTNLFYTGTHNIGSCAAVLYTIIIIIITIIIVIIIINKYNIIIFPIECN